MQQASPSTSSHHPSSPSASIPYNPSLPSPSTTDPVRPPLDNRPSSSSVVSVGRAEQQLPTAGWTDQLEGLGLGVGEHIPVQFDEGVLRQLCDLDVGLSFFFSPSSSCFFPEGAFWGGERS